MTTSAQPYYTTVDARAGTSLDNTDQNCTEYTVGGTPWRAYYNAKRRRGRGFHRAFSGMRLGGQYRMLTLTTSVAAVDAGLDIGRSWRALLMRLRRRGLIDGYFKVKEYTHAGRPHLHVVFRGRFIAQWVVSQWWLEVHRSPVVDIRYLHDKRRSAGYVAKYLGKDIRARYSWSWDWLWRGFGGDWRRLVRRGYRKGWPFPFTLLVWHLLVDKPAFRAVYLEMYREASICSYRFLTSAVTTLPPPAGSPGSLNGEGLLAAKAGLRIPRQLSLTMP